MSTIHGKHGWLQSVAFAELRLLPRADDAHSALVGAVIRQDEDGHGQAADEEDRVHGALSVEVGFLAEASLTVARPSRGLWESGD